jgi:hypothetical protein
MTLPIDVDGLLFSFPDDWEVEKYDLFNFYRNQFSKVCTSVKALDLLAISPDATLWLIEVKDYSKHSRTKALSMAEEVTQKVFDTLAALMPMKINANDEKERLIAKFAVSSMKLRVVLHLEQPANYSKLWKPAINPANIKLELRKKLKAIDPHPLIVSMNSMKGLQWDVKREPSKE